MNFYLNGESVSKMTAQNAFFNGATLSGMDSDEAAIYWRQSVKPQTGQEARELLLEYGVEIIF